MVVVSDVADAEARFGDRYLARMFTEQEKESCQGVPTVRASALAARVAAKEAVMKVLRPTGPLPWTSIEVVRHGDGWCDLVLSGPARRLADDAGLQHFALSMSHEAGMAGAVVVASAVAH